MTAVRRDIWQLGSEEQPWHPITLAYARAVRSMQQLPLTDPRSWRYQAAIHGVAGVTAPQGAPWNECQHASWYFLPWHRMYLFRFEQIIRSFIPVGDGRDTWALPYWDYSSGAPGSALPPAFRAGRLPDDSVNPLFVAARRASVNKGEEIPDLVTDTSAAMAEDVFTETGLGASTGFGGPRTGFAHQGPAFGALEAQPHGPVHVWVGGANGLMRDPNTAALDPVFWLHHANIDRLWEHWLGDGHTNPEGRAWRDRRFRLRDAAGAPASLRPRDVLDTAGLLGYTYDSLPVEPPDAREAIPHAREGAPVPKRPRPVLIGTNEEPVELTRRGAAAQVALGPVPATAEESGRPPRTYLNLADIEGEDNLGVVYGVYVNLPDDAAADVRAEHLAGVVSFFGIELSTPAGAAESGQAAHGMRYSFDITALVDRLRAGGDWDPVRLRVTLHPVEGSDEAETAAEDLTVDRPATRIGTLGVYQA
jgi:hypothetical protein